jgi:hypothetical protein
MKTFGGRENLTRGKQKTIWRCGIALLAAFCVVLCGCTAQQWFQVIGALIPIVGNTVTAFGDFGASLKGGALTPQQSAAIQNYTADAQTVFTDVGNDVAGWTSSTSASVATNVANLLNQLSTQTNQLIPALGVKDPTVLQGAETFTTTILADAADMLKLIPLINGQPVSSTSTAARITGWDESDFQLVQYRTVQGGKTATATAAVATPAKLRALQREFVKRQNAISKKKTGNAEVDKALAKVKKISGPTAVGSLVRLQKP